MLLVAAQAGVLDYAIVLVAVLSEASPFSHHSEESDDALDSKSKDEDESLDTIDKNLLKEEAKADSKRSKKWNHRGGDVLAAMLAVGAYTYAGRGAGGSSENLAHRSFCNENGLNYTIMTRIQRMRSHLATIAKNRLGSASGVAAMTGGFSYKMTPPNKLQERLLMQTIASGLLDHVAVLAPAGTMSGNDPNMRSAYMLCTSASSEPLFLDRTSTVYSRAYRQLPRWVCYDSILRKTTKDGTPIAVMKNITPIEASWLGDVAKGTQLLTFCAPLPSPPPIYDAGEDAILCSVATKFGSHGWEIPPVKRVLYDVLQGSMGKQAAGFHADDSYRWFARFLLEGKVFPELEELELNDAPALITRRSPLAKVNLLVGALCNAGVDSARALRKHWAETNDKFLFKHLKQWIKVDHQEMAKKLWIETVQSNIKQFKTGG
jgi:ATP-dependent RNA helicase DHX37/DHR1